LGYWPKSLSKTPPQQCISSLFTLDGRRDISLQKLPRTCAAGSSNHQLVCRTSLQFFHRYAPTAHPVWFGSFKARGVEFVGFAHPLCCAEGALANIFSDQRCSNPHKTVRIVHTMILIHFSQHAVFSATFNGANYPSRQGLNHYFFREIVTLYRSFCGMHSLGFKAMNKEDFKQRLREKLRKTPLETRKQWTDTDLFIWWTKAKAEDSYLTWERCSGDLWQYVPGMCRDLIGNDAF
jgi:hypothetical protein